MQLETPRKLRLLRIDDDIRPDDIARLEEHFSVASVLDREGLVFDGIVGWSSALSFWSNFERFDRIDIIVSDVKFVDPTSPLGALELHGDTLHTPNGLSYFIPLAAVARVSGAPLGIALHSADSGYWKTRSKDLEPLAVRTMSFFAAHQVGLLAAILNDPAPANVDQCWDYISAKAKDDHRLAVCAALHSYRSKLDGMYVLPDAWRELNAWCSVRFETAQQKSGVLLGDNPGLKFMRGDGSKDWICLQSLFADAPLAEPRFDFELKRLPAYCFKVEAPPAGVDAFALDERFHPRIGALVQRLSRLHLADEEARHILKQFPLDSFSNVSLTEYAKQINASPLGKMIAILFQDLELRLKRRREWHRLYAECPWDISQGRFDDERLHTLKTIVEIVQANLAADSAITIHDIDDALSAIAPECEPDASIPLVIAILQDIGKLGAATDNAYPVLRSGIVDTLPEVPDSLPSNFNSHATIEYDGASGTRNAILAQWFGYGDDANGPKKLRRVVAEFVTGKADSDTVGTDILNRYYEGHAEGWIKQLCRDYLRSRGWSDPRAWPKSVAQAGTGADAI